MFAYNRTMCATFTQHAPFDVCKRAMFVSIKCITRIKWNRRFATPLVCMCVCVFNSIDDHNKPIFFC